VVLLLTLIPKHWILTVALDHTVQSCIATYSYWITSTHIFNSNCTLCLSIKLLCSNCKPKYGLIFIPSDETQHKACSDNI
jgi:hypothetical protein